MVLTLLAVFVGALAIFTGTVHHFYLSPVIQILGIGRVVQSIGNDRCTTVPELQACEKIILHQPSGVLYLACSTQDSRSRWLPAGERFNLTGRSTTDFVATYDPTTKVVTRLQTTDFQSARGLSLHGMDVVPSSTDPKRLLVYLVNHRAPLDQDPYKVGADSVIEIFETTIASRKLVHRQTIEDPVIIAPNDVVGSSDGQSFYFTNDHGSKIRFARSYIEIFSPASSVGYCHVNDGCKFAITKMFSNNGIVRADNDTFYVANSFVGKLNVLEKGNDNSLVLTDTIKTDQGLDNVSLDADGAIWAVGFPRLYTLFKHIGNPGLLSPSSVLKFTANRGPGSFYGEKYIIEKVFEDDGALASGATSAVYDTRRRVLYLHGLASPWLTICKL
ncbi:serum paraoxonase/arylesterase [Pluteus cervinus]|uniref:Serum paraoxonase/arylesterase n=1 Tax=Pluteus cervinus TaxID=181527 RepID=A0ACD3BB48_9AGAR|nr:serum paraoxonase/arylesterase [Pluteus cervinus]